MDLSFQQINIMDQLLIATFHPHLQKAVQLLEIWYENNPMQFLTSLFDLTTSNLSQNRIIACCYLKNILLKQAQLPYIDQLFIKTIRISFGKTKETQTLLECVGIYVSKRQRRTHCENFLNSLIRYFHKEISPTILFYILKTIFQSMLEQKLKIQNLIIARLLKNIVVSSYQIEGHVQIECQLLLSLLCSISILWQRVSNLLFYHAEKKYIFILVCKLCQQSFFLKTEQQCIRIFNQINFKLSGVPLYKYTQEQITIVLTVWAQALKKMQQFCQAEGLIKQFINNFEIFCSSMNLIISILEHFGSQVVQINEKVVVFIQNYCSLIMDQTDEQRLQIYGEKLRQYQKLFGKEDNMLLLLTGAPARIISIFGGQKIIQNVLSKMQIKQPPTTSALTFLNHVFQRFVMLPTTLIKSIGQYFLYTYRVSQARNIKFYAFNLLCNFYIKQNESKDSICGLFQEGLQFLIEGWNKEMLNNEEKQLIEQSLNILLQINNNEKINKLCISLLQKCQQMNKSKHIIFRSSSPSTILCQYITKSLELNTFSSIYQDIIQQGIVSNSVIGEQIALELVRKILSKVNQALRDNGMQERNKLGYYFESIIKQRFILFLCKCISSQPASKQGNLQEFFMESQSNRCPFYTSSMVIIAGIISEIILYNYIVYEEAIFMCLNCLAQNNHYCAVFFQLISFLILETGNLQASIRFRNFLVNQQNQIRKKQYMLNIELIKCNQQDFDSIKLIQDEKIVNRINLRLWELENDTSSIQQMLKKLEVTEISEKQNKHIVQLARFPYNWCQKISTNLLIKLKQDNYYNPIYYMRKSEQREGK